MCIIFPFAQWVFLLLKRSFFFILVQHWKVRIFLIFDMFAIRRKCVSLVLININFFIINAILMIEYLIAFDIEIEINWVFIFLVVNSSVVRYCLLLSVYIENIAIFWKRMVKILLNRESCLITRWFINNYLFLLLIESLFSRCHSWFL